jgi:hypothetical protein
MPEGMISPERFVLNHGQPYYADDLSYRGRRGTAKECYANAARAARKNPRLTYVEGYAGVRGFSTAHAWTTDGDNHVIDRTIRLKDAESVTYFGVSFTSAYLASVIRKTDEYGSILEFAREAGGGLLKGEGARRVAEP